LGLTSALIIGVDGQLGGALFKDAALNKAFSVYGTSRRQETVDNLARILHLDLADDSLVRDFNWNFDHIVVCAGITRSIDCEENPKDSFRINVENTCQIIRSFSAKGAHVIFISSSLVFDGTVAFRAFDDNINPQGKYGLFKATVEREFVDDPNVAILRLTKVVSDLTPFIVDWRLAIKDGKAFTAFSDRFISPVCLQAVIRNIHLLIQRRAVGVFQFGGEREISYADFAKEYFACTPNALRLLRIEGDKTQRTARHNSLQTRLPTLEYQYSELLRVPRQLMGLMSAHAYLEDPKRLAFTLSRYKFVAKMLAGRRNVLEIGCADGFGSAIVSKEVGRLTAADFDSTFISDARVNHPYKDRIIFKQADLVRDSIREQFDAAFALDVLEHIRLEDEPRFLSNICDSLKDESILIVGLPSFESQRYASSISKAGHVNCKTGQDLKSSLEPYFQYVFIFSMNDEVVHTGYTPMAHYLLGLCVAKR